MGDPSAWDQLGVAPDPAARDRNLLASIVESSHEAIISKTLDGVITSWNPAAERLHGYTAAEVIGRRADMLFPEELREHEWSLLARVARGEQVARYHTQRLRRDGSRVSVSLTLSPVTDAAGHIMGVASVSSDLTDLQRAEARFRGLLESAPDAIVGVGADGRIVIVNVQAERLFGYPRDELLGQPIELLVPDSARERHPGHRRRYFERAAPRPMGAGMHLAARRRDGTEFPAEISLSPLDTEEGPMVSAAIRDVSDRLELLAEQERLKAAAERERLEAQLHQSQRLESLGQLAGGVAHDFNNLLAVMLNYTTFIAEEVTEAAAREHGHRWHDVLNDLTQVRRAGDRATELIHQLLAFGRREVVRPVVLDLNGIVAEVEQLLRRTLGEHVQLHTDLAAGLWPVLADPGQLEQVLVNLAVNARDAMPDGGALTIATGNEAEPAGRFVKLRVADTGVGMSPEVIERVFEPFFTTKRRGEGTGLGLATVYGIITQAGGRVAIDSVPGAGTAFTAMLPATDQAAAGPQAVTGHDRPRGGGEVVLVVEDEPALRELTRRILERNGYRALVAADGPEALKTAQDPGVEIDLLLTDVVMPHMLGKDLAARLRLRYPDVPVLYMSGYAQPVLTNQGTLEPDVTLIEKPFTEPALLARIREVFAAASTRRPSGR